MDPTNTERLPVFPPYRVDPGFQAANRAWKRPKAPALALRGKELLGALAIALACDVTLYDHDHFDAGGFGLALFFAVVPIAMFVTTRKFKGSIRLAVIAALLGAVVVRSFVLPTAGTVLAGIGLLAAFGVTLRSPRTFVPEALVSFFVNVAKIPARFVAAKRGVGRYTGRTKLRGISLRPILIPAALCLAFVGVFSLANPIVANAVSVSWKTVANLVALPAPSRVVLWSISAVGALALIRPAMRLARGSEILAEQTQATTTSLATARNALVGLNVLFLAYNALDAACLWSGAPPAGMRTQQYAHEGAFWLTFALILLTGVVGVMFRGSLAQDTRAALSRKLALTWCGQGLFLALGTYRRIAIHIGRSGLSDLRIVGILGTTLVVAGLVLVALKLRGNHTFRWLLRRQLDAFAMMFVVYSITPTHLLSAKVNVARISSGEYRPLLHMFRQAHSPESASTVVALLDHPDERVRKGIASLLISEDEALGHGIESETSWRARDIGGRQAKANLDEAMPKAHAVLGTTDPIAAEQVLLEISRVAAEDRSIEEILAIPSADTRGGGTTNRSY